MKKNIALLVGFIFLLGLFVINAGAQDVDKLTYPKLHKINIPKVERVTLDNGIRLYLLEDKGLPLFNASVRINCGSYLDPPEKIGLADLVGTVLRTGGTAKWSGDEIDEMLEGVGGSVETYMGILSGGASVNILSDYTDMGLEVLADILQHPIFDEDKIELAKVQVRSSISRRNDDPQQIATREFKKIIYGADSPYARHPEYATINAITRDDLVNFHKKYFHPQNVQIAIWGDFDKNELLKKIKTYFGGWEKTDDMPPPPPKVNYEFKNKVYYIEKNDVNQSNIVLGHIGGFITDDDYAARIVMNNILGGAFGSRLFNSVRSREGLAYAVFGVYTARIAYPGVFYNFASTKSETTAKTVQEIIKEIKRMQTDPPTEEEMRMGKDGYLNSFVFNFDSKGEVATRLMRYDFYGLPEDFIFKEKEMVEKVTPQDVLNAAKKNLHPEALQILVVGKGSDFDMPLDQLGYGPVDTIDITIPSGEEKKELSLTPENLRKGKEILEKAVAAHGGLDNFKNVKTVKVKGTVLFSMGGTEIPITIDWFMEFPDKSKSVMNVMGQKMIRIRNGQTGWKTDRMTMKLTEMTEEDIADLDKEMTRNTIHIFSSLDKPYYRAVYSGSGEVEGAPAEFVTLVDDQGEEICKLGFNKDTYELVSKAYYSDTPMGAGTVIESYSNYTTVEGIKLPMNSISKLNDQKFSEQKIDSYTINETFPPGTFEKNE